MAAHERQEGGSERAAAAAPLVLVALLGGWLVVGDIVAPALWEDEADTAVFARNVVRFGLPLAWDGRTFLDSDYGRRIAPKLLGAELVMVGTPWLPYYVAAASLALFGESTWAARLPFAAAGLGTVFLLYALVRRASGDRRAGLAAALLLLLSTQFLLYSNECRSYPLNMLLTLVLLGGFLRLGERRRDPWFAIAAIALFHVQVLPAVVAVAACAGLTLVHPAFRPRLRPLLARAPWVASLTLPWLAVSWSGSAVNWQPLSEAGDLPRRIGQLAYESGAAIPWLGWLLGLPWLWPRASDAERRWLVLCGALIAATIGIAPLLLADDRFIAFGIRYACGLLPIGAGVTGILVTRASRDRPARWAALVALFGLTNLPGGALVSFLAGESGRLPIGILATVPRETSFKLLNLTWWAYARAVGAPDPGTTSEITSFLAQRASPEDHVVTNWSWENLYFYTDLAQCLRLPEESPEAVRAAARAAGLPDCVFDPDGADWVVWRPAGDPIPGWELERLERELAARGASLELLARFRESLWENRPELAYHRFPGVGYPYFPDWMGGAHPRFRDASVYRVRWRLPRPP
jgi:hypothetical protein